MPSDRLVLSFDTSAAYCAAALFSGERELACRVEDMARGQAERLMPLLQEVLDSAGVNWADLNRIGVGIGPGNFTGIRISVSAARGLALGLGVPAIGVTGFDAIRGGTAGIAAIPGPRETFYVQHGTDAPQILSADALPDAAQQRPDGATLVRNIACLAATRDPAAFPAKPFYTRPADAAPPSDPPPRILDDA